MPKVGVNNEPLLERLVFAYDGTNYRVVKCDSGGNLVAALNAGSTIAVTQATAASLKALVDLNADQNVQARNYNWWNAGWSKAAPPWGFTTRFFEQIYVANAAAGNNDLLIAAVAAGYVTVITCVTGVDVQTTPSYFQVIFNNGTSSYAVAQMTPPAANTVGAFAGTYVVGPADRLGIRFGGCALNDDLVVNVYGYTMQVGA